MRSLKYLASAAAVMLLAIPSAPVRADPAATRESMTFKGTSAMAVWASETEVPIGTPRIVYVAGVSEGSILRHRVAGTKPVKEARVSLVAMALMLPGPDPGSEAVPAELWCLAPAQTFSIDRTLTRAELDYSCDAILTGADDEPTGQTVPLTVHATWTGTGTLNSTHSISSGSDELGWWLDREHSTTRMASSEIVITGPDGVLFGESIGGEQSDGGQGQAELSRTSAGHLFHAY